MSDMFVIYPKLAKKLFDQLQIFINTKFIILFNSKVLWYMENCLTGKLASVPSPGKLPSTLTLSQTFTLILIQGGNLLGGSLPEDNFTVTKYFTYATKKQDLYVQFSQFNFKIILKCKQTFYWISIIFFLTEPVLLNCYL